MKSIWKKIVDLIEKYGIYFYAFLVVVLNVSLMFDHVVWGDEAFCANAVKNNVKGILQIVYFNDSNPPLYHLWLKIFEALFQGKLWALHMSSVVPFVVGIVLCVTIGKKLFGNIPAFLFVTLSGLSKTCAEYNQEIRMYSLSFFFIVLLCFMSATILVGKEKKSAWILMTFAGLGAAYSHYYGFMTAGLLIFFTAFFYWVFSKKNRYKGLISLGAFVVLYIPWMPVLLHHMRDVGNDWWNDSNPPLWDLLRVVLFSERLRYVLLPLFVVLFAATLVFGIREYKSKHEIPNILKVSLPFICTILFVFLAGYLLGTLFQPILIPRYLYSLCPVVLLFMMCMITYLCMQKKVCTIIGIAALIVVMGISAFDFKDYRSKCKVEEEVTKEFLELIGTPDENTAFMSTGVPHLSWTVLQYYYPDNEVLGIAGGDSEEVSDDVTTLWRMRDDEETWLSMNTMQERGYTYEDLGIHHLGKYSFFLYRYTK